MRTSRLLLLVGLLLLPHTGWAQSLSRAIRVEGQFAIPVFDLADRFGAHPTGSLGYEWQISPQQSLELRAQAAFFRKGTLNLMPERPNYPGIEADSISVQLDLVGGSVLFSQQLAQLGALEARFRVGAGVYHWVDRRGAYPSQEVPRAERRRQWSGAMHVGADLVFPIAGPLDLVAGAHYTFLPGELWQAERIRLDQVRTFNWVTASVGTRFRF